jgi:hypothetical protein
MLSARRAAARAVSLLTGAYAHLPWRKPQKFLDTPVTPHYVGISRSKVSHTLLRRSLP